MSTAIISQLNESEIARKYKAQGKYSFPAYEKVDPEFKKSAQYCKDVASAAFSALMRDRTAIPVEYYSYIQILRDYGTGTQAQGYYTNLFKESEPKKPSEQISEAVNYNSLAERKRRGDNNVNPKIVSIATSMKNAIHGMFDEYEEDLYVQSIDNESGAVEEDAMFEALWDAQHSDFTQSVQQQYGVPIHEETNIPNDVTIDELMVYKESGGFKTLWAESMEECLRFTEKFSKWDKILKRKLIDDGVDINFMAARVARDHKSGKEKWLYVDPQNFVIQFSQDQNFEDAEYAGYFTLEKLGNLVEKGFSTDDLISAAQNYEDLWDNPTDIDWGAYERTQAFNERIFDFKVPVFHFNWVDVDVKRSVRYENNNGSQYTYNLKFDQKLRPLTDYRKKQGTVSMNEVKTRIQKAYQCSWVVDTNMVYDFGPVPNQSRKDKRNAKLSFVAWRGITTNRRMIFGSIMESILPFLDHLHIAWTKYQDSIIKSSAGGYELNIRLLQNLKVGGEVIDPLDAYKMFWEKGVLPYMDVPMGERYSGGSVRPLTKVEGTQGELMTVIQAEIAFVISMIERITGIAPTTMGAAPDGSQPVSTTQMAAQGTTNVLKPLLNGLFIIKEGLGEETALRLPILFRNVPEERKAYSKIIGEDSVDVIRQAERAGVEYGLYLEARPSGADVQELITMVQTAMQRGRDGEASVNISQGFYIIERIKSGGNFKKLQRQVDMMIRKSEQEAFEKKRALITEQNQQQAQIVQAQQQGEMQSKQMDTQNTIAIDNNKHRNDIQRIQIEANLKYRDNLMGRQMELAKIKSEQEKLQPVV